MDDGEYGRLDEVVVMMESNSTMLLRRSVEDEERRGDDRVKEDVDTTTTRHVDTSKDDEDRSEKVMKNQSEFRSQDEDRIHPKEKDEDLVLTLKNVNNDEDGLDDDDDDDDDELDDDDDELEYRSEEVRRWKISQRHRNNMNKNDRLHEDLSSMMNLEIFSRESEKDKDGDAFSKDSIRRVCGLDGCDDDHVGCVVLGSSSEGVVDVYANRDFEQGEVVEVCAYVESGV